jgi:hypothetical protein
MNLSHSQPNRYYIAVFYPQTLVEIYDYVSVLKEALLANIVGKNNKLHGCGYGVKADENSKDKYS